MQKGIFSLLFICWLSNTQAQLLNPSFETTDSMGKVADWQLTQGKLTRHAVINFDFIPFTAAHGNYFVQLEPDTSSIPLKRALLEQQVAFSDTPASFYLNYLYIPENTEQHAKITLLFTKWNGTLRDTILYITDTIPVIANGNEIPVQWNTYSLNLRDAYRASALPDTAWIQLGNDDGSVAGKKIRLYADNLSFGKWPVGIKEEYNYTLNIFPNPATDYLTIETNDHIEDSYLLFTDLNGKQFTITGYQIRPDHQIVIPVSEIPGGLYSFSIITHGSQLKPKLVYIQH